MDGWGQGRGKLAGRSSKTGMVAGYQKLYYYNLQLNVKIDLEVIEKTEVRGWRLEVRKKGGGRWQM